MASGDVVLAVTTARLQNEVDALAATSSIELAGTVGGIAKAFDATLNLNVSALGINPNGLFKFGTNYTVTVTET